MGPKPPRHQSGEKKGELINRNRRGFERAVWPFTPAVMTAGCAVLADKRSDSSFGYEECPRAGNRTDRQAFALRRWEKDASCQIWNRGLHLRTCNSAPFLPVYRRKDVRPRLEIREALLEPAGLPGGTESSLLPPEE